MHLNPNPNRNAPSIPPKPIQGPSALPSAIQLPPPPPQHCLINSSQAVYTSPQNKLIRTAREHHDVNSPPPPPPLTTDLSTHTITISKMDQAKELLEMPREFLNDGRGFITRCSKREL
jgi:hypothetical protein